ncbi:hypothetical protein [Lacrimispora indolis]|uniref:hypothetical protein n=1 Tax=Lacrimispora indolis TaxID=69825 RepID=UPI00040A0E75|nr:hypothetical protein [[Clostridium] methoxybenzovorans]
MAGQIKTNEAGFVDAINTLNGKITELESKNYELLNRLDELEAIWLGTSSHSYKHGSGCVYANSVKSNRDIVSLRSYVKVTKDAIDLFDFSHSRLFSPNPGK